MNPHSSNRQGVLVVVALATALSACGDDATGPSRQADARIEFVNVWQPIALSPDGRTALLQDIAGDAYFYHTRSGELEFRTHVGDPLLNIATGLSANGVITALHGDPVQAGFWTERGEWTDLVTPYRSGCFSGHGDDTGGAWDVSADGAVIVGLVWNGCNAEAFRWDAKGSGIMTRLELLGESYPGSSNPPTNRASVVSQDGRLAAGFAQTAMVDRWPAVWQADGSGTLLTGFPDDTPGEVMAMSPDGRVLAGYWGSHGFYWTQATGTVDLGQLPGADPFFDPVILNAVGADGTLLFGISGSPFFSIPQAIVWTAGGGLRPLTDVITAAGVTIPDGYTLTNVLAASNDGRVVLGSAWDPDGNTVSFVLHLPLSAYGL